MFGVEWREERSGQERRGEKSRVERRGEGRRGVERRSNQLVELLRSHCLSICGLWVYR
jgi:hypothetical protein